MWRRTLLISQGFLGKHKVLPKSDALHQVLQSSSSHLITWVSKKPTFSHNLRRFSTDASDIELDVASRPYYSPLPSAESDQNVSAIDKILNNRRTLVGKDYKIVEVDVEKLENVLSLLQSSCGDDESLIASLEGMGLVLSNKFLVRFVEILLLKEKQKIPIENLIAFFSWCIEEIYVRRDAKVALARALCSAFKNLEEKESGLLTTETLNELIYLFLRLHKEKAAFEIFNKFEEFGCVADGDTYCYIIYALSNGEFCNVAYSPILIDVTQRMLDAGILPPNAKKVENIIDSLWGVDQSRVAYSVYMFAKTKNISPEMYYVSRVINALCDHMDNKIIYHENIYMALSILEGFSGEDTKSMLEGFTDLDGSWKPGWKDDNCFYSVIESLCEIGDVEKAKELLFKMIDAGTPPGESIFCEIVHWLLKAGDLEEATKILNLTRDRNFSYCATISCYVERGAIEEAQKVIYEAIRSLRYFYSRAMKRSLLDNAGSGNS